MDNSLLLSVVIELLMDDCLILSVVTVVKLVMNCSPILSVVVAATKGVGYIN